MIARPLQLFWRIFPVMMFVLVMGAAGVFSQSSEISGRFFLGWLIGCSLLAAVLSFWLARGITRSLRDLGQELERIGGGDWGQRVRLKNYFSDEIYQFTQRLNETGLRLARHMKAEQNRQREQSAVLASMAEGVLAIDHNERVVQINLAAASMLGLKASRALGVSLEEAVRIPPLQEFIRASLVAESPSHIEVESFEQNGRFVQVRSSPLRGSGNEQIGAVFVFSDITTLRRLEKHRREFVANVSHELKTPLTAIQGFAETLLNPAVTDAGEQKKFADAIQRHSVRLNALIDDLLTLSRLERVEGKSQLKKSTTALSDVMAAAVEICNAAAQGKQIDLRFDCPTSLEIEANAPLLQQALVNLLDNAIKYSEPERAVVMSVQCVGAEVTIHVKDQGSGIAKEHISRLFERFYRVDRARSRAVGGTGLGLAIVKHVALAHGGQVVVRSEVGAGSEFIIHLPKSSSSSNFGSLEPGTTS